MRYGCNAYVNRVEENLVAKLDMVLFGVAPVKKAPVVNNTPKPDKLVYRTGHVKNMALVGVRS